MTRRGGAVFVALMLGSIGCGKKGPPLPPFSNLPAAPGEFTASRRGSDVDLQFAVPGANVDGSTPAEVTRIEVYAINGPISQPVDDIVRRGTRVGHVEVVPPPDPDAEEGSGKAKASAAPLAEGEARQGDVVHLTVPFALDGPAPADTDVRSYVAVGFNRRGRRGAVSRRVVVFNGVPPAAPTALNVKYDESGITLAWAAPSDTPGAGVAYHVYLLGEQERRQTERPQSERQFVDPHIEWDAERCYAVRAVATAGELSIESEPSARACVTPKDTFAPKAPVGLQVIAADGAVNLIWDANTESDLAGYIVLRAIAPASDPVSITPTPIEQATFTDAVPSGSRVTYAVQAVDKAGNISPPSARVAETAR